MLEKQMEEAVANCPDLFIEPRLTLVRRQVVINGRRPDLLFSDVLSRYLLVELQCGRLDEDHLQRHFYYYFDYRAKYPSIPLRLMFIANRLVPQHKQFLDEHGYEFREYPEREFERLTMACRTRAHDETCDDIEDITTPGVLAPSTYELLYEIEKQPMTMSYKMLLLMLMSELADSDGRVPLPALADGFHRFFVDRSLHEKVEENPRRTIPRNGLAARTSREWERVIRTQPVRFLGPSFLVDEGSTIRWAPRIFRHWDTNLKHEIHRGAFDRLVRYFNRNVPGGF
jgi:Endonuclease NucS